MPYLELKVSATPDEGLVGKAGALLTELTSTILSKKPELTAIAIQQVPPANWYVAGALGAGTPQAFFSLIVHVTTGTNTKDQKSEFVAQASRALGELLGGANPISYVIVKEVTADAWGYDGKTQEHRYVSAKLNHP